MASLKYRKPFLDALCEEIRLQRNYLEGKSIGSVYFGGGTPSLLDTEEILRLLAELRKYHTLEAEAEITMEANPDDVNPEKLKGYLNAGINRISIGVQSFFDEDLKYLNRIHSARQSFGSVRMAREEGFRNISIDLIFGIPGLTAGKWEENLSLALATQVDHISAYALTVEPGTALDLLIKKQKLGESSEEETVSQFRLLMEKLKINGFQHYEISNFCREGYISLHNSNYWNGEHYLGLGPSAHSFNGASRQWNVASVTGYIGKVRGNGLFFESETLTPEQKFNEYVMTSLRTMWGCDMNRLSQEFGEDLASCILHLASSYIEKGMMTEKNGIYCLTDHGKLFADAIASDFFVA